MAPTAHQIKRRQQQQQRNIHEDSYTFSDAQQRAPGE
jgi:hypothetical protein